MANLKQIVTPNFAKPSQQLLTSDEDLTPEMLGEILSEVKASMANFEKIKATGEFWAERFSKDEKRRFLISVGKVANTFSMAEWIDLMAYDSFDVLMFVSKSRKERADVIRRNL